MQVPESGDGTNGAVAAMAPAAVGSPPATRITLPRWRDGRLVLGVVLVLLSVLLGARLLSGAQRRTDVVVAARPLQAGHVVTAGDLEVRAVRLSGVGGHYWPGADLTGLLGHAVMTAVAAGDLLPRSVVAAEADPKPARVVSVPVDPTRLPVLGAGDRVDVFATYDAAAGKQGRTAAVLRGAEYLGSGDTATGTRVAVRLRVPVDSVGALVRASEVAGIDLVRQLPAGDEAGDVGQAAVVGPGGERADSSGSAGAAG